jgi:hypothetical protein
LVGPREVAFQVVEIKVDWSNGQAYEGKEGCEARTFGVTGRSLLDPLVEVLKDLFGEAVGVDHIVEFELLRLGGVLAARDDDNVGSRPSLGLRISGFLGLHI